MINVINEKQKIYDVYRLLSTPGNILQAEELAENNLFKALSVYMSGPSVPTEDTPVLVHTIDLSLIVFYYKATDLFEEVFKRTSYIARSRRDKETKQHLLDVISLTKDEQDLFDPFLRDATTKIFERLAAFTKEVSSAYMHLAPSGLPGFVPNRQYHVGSRIYEGLKVWESDEEYIDQSFDNGSWHELNPCYYTDDKTEFVVMKRDWMNANAINPCDTAIFEALVAYVMARWFTIVFPEEAKFYFEEFDRPSTSITRNLNSQNRPLNRRHRMF